MNENNKFSLLYYLGLLAIFMSWTDPLSVPNHFFIVAFLIALFVPLIIELQDWLPAILSLFIILAKVGVSNSYLPSNPAVYLLITFVALIIKVSKSKYNIPPPSIMVLFIIVCFDYLFFGSNQTSSERYTLYWILFLTIFWNYYKCPNCLHIFSLVLIVASVCLSLQFLILGHLYSFSYQDTERISWMDPNYFGVTLGMGVVAAATEFYLGEFKNGIYKALAIASILLSLIVMLLNASRGSLLAVAVAVSILIYKTQIKTAYKFIIVILIVAVMFLLYNWGYMDLLQARIESAGSNVTNRRSDIWRIKLQSFANSDSIIKYLIGYGSTAGKNLGFSHPQGFHNDFVAFLVNYGFIGLILFVKFIFKPLQYSNNENRTVVLAATMFLIVSSFVLEPFTFGSFPNYAFYYYALLLSQCKMPQEVNGC